MENDLEPEDTIILSKQQFKELLHSSTFKVPVMYSNFDMVKEFHNKFGIKQAALNDVLTQDLRLNLIREELNEVEDELCPYDESTGTITFPDIVKSRLAKELADLLYVVYGTAVTFDIPIDKVFHLVHKSNMSKLGSDGKPVYRKDGKVTKGSNYQPPDLSWLDKKEEDE